ncbi:glycosyltransferase [Flavobacteriaceae bacterium AU392]|nr:glycosyltransferase [Flavobacteriaceae bacterium]RKM82833.1 glycosyltransferase [Flavobacteriaceae bacterium AU392]
MTKTFALIICTYMRPKSLLELLQSVCKQTLYPNEILIIDGSINDETEQVLIKNQFKNLRYFKVNEINRGLTKQRNYGINLVTELSEIICFLDDDVVLTPMYFKTLLETYNTHNDALAVGGYITNEVEWKIASIDRKKTHFYYDNWMRSEPSRFQLRRKFGLLPDKAPGFLPTFSHGRSISFLPPTGKIYKVEQLMGGVSSFKKEIFKTLSFSTYFEGYGLYEDADFSLRVAEKGAIYINTNAQLAHHHSTLGRPNQYKYGKMVLRNGWYIWRMRYPKPTLKARLKWNATAFLLTAIRYTNVITSKSKLAALTESLGRTIGWWSILLNAPKIER